MNKDYGIDLNQDNHCDNCGWFVDSYGHHRTRLIFDDVCEEIELSWITEDLRLNNLSVQKLIEEFYKGSPLNMYKNHTYCYWPLILKYSLNNLNDPFSCRGLNDFLRHKKIPKGVNSLDLLNTALYMNLAISKFELKKTLITFRGLAFDKNDAFVRLLDTALVKLKHNKSFSFVDNGFVSTTRSAEYAKHMAFAKNKKVKVFCSYISLPNSHAMPLSEEWNTTAKEYEKEVLLKSMQTYYICEVKKTIINDNIYYYVSIINSKEKIYD